MFQGEFSITQDKKCCQGKDQNLDLHKNIGDIPENEENLRYFIAKSFVKNLL